MDIPLETALFWKLVVVVYYNVVKVGILDQFLCINGCLGVTDC